jgi:hypothetical protein
MSLEIWNFNSLKNLTIGYRLDKNSIFFLNLFKIKQKKDSLLSKLKFLEFFTRCLDILKSLFKNCWSSCFESKTRKRSNKTSRIKAM